MILHTGFVVHGLADLQDEKHLVNVELLVEPSVDCVMELGLVLDVVLRWPA